MDAVRQVITDDYAIYNDDSLEVSSEMPDESIHFSIYSPPFGTPGGGALYHYSSSPRDLSNARSYEEFLEHYDFFISEIYRMTKPGRATAVHCMDVSMSNSGHADFMMNFPGDIIELHVKCRDPHCQASAFEKKHGLCGHGWFGWKSRHFIWKEPLGVRNRTMAKKLAHQTIVEDATQAGVASADQLLVFNKRGKNEIPVEHPYGLRYYAGERQMPSSARNYKNWPGKQTGNKFSHWIWRQYASSNWDDIRIDNVLPYEESKEEDDERHVHPLQLDVIERAIVLNTNEREVVWTPFMGVGSEVYGAVKLNRTGVGAELKASYFRQAVRNLEKCQRLEIAEPVLPGFGELM